MNIEPEVKIEVETEIGDFGTEKYDLSQIVGEKRKNDYIDEIKPKKFKEEFVLVEESHLQTKATDKDTDNPVSN